MTTTIADLTRPEFEERIRNRVLVIPIGSIEQHGPHLPIGTDSHITTALIEELCRLRGDRLLLAPPLPLSASDEHSSFQGTFSMGTNLLASLLKVLTTNDPVQSRTLLVSAHGGNLPAFLTASQPFWIPRTHVLVEAAAQWELPADARGIWEPDAHAGRTETSVMLALRPDLVHLNQAVSGYNGSLSSVGTILASDGIRGVSSSGVLGDPAGANREEGLAILAALAADLVRTFDQVSQ
ncbi:mycofactocin biosynthesis peptidyl-dipeptidase MftE [Ferrimicrobium sp.]|uniref:mycofactocin biosynthesis peptidyl-dipeptidase MftE n=1 Tax=Ferrimicrobium sp. TaxID=2926050 RepID=UPI002606DE14|nr:mycofactocin biosynthesis peptidyl-dipeptidase MftE [Ferrimicrobium sp.]